MCTKANEHKRQPIGAMASRSLHLSPAKSIIRVLTSEAATSLRRDDKPSTFAEDFDHQVEICVLGPPPVSSANSFAKRRVRPLTDGGLRVAFATPATRVRISPFKQKEVASRRWCFCSVYDSVLLPSLLAGLLSDGSVCGTV